MTCKKLVIWRPFFIEFFFKLFNDNLLFRQICSLLCFVSVFCPVIIFFTEPLQGDFRLHIGNFVFSTRNQELRCLNVFIDLFFIESKKSTGARILVRVHNCKKWNFFNQSVVPASIHARKSSFSSAPNRKCHFNFTVMPCRRRRTTYEESTQLCWVMIEISSSIPRCKTTLNFKDFLVVLNDQHSIHYTTFILASIQFHNVISFIFNA